MTNIFEEIRNTVEGVVGTYLMDMNGDMIAHDVPTLFEDELIQSSSDMYQLIDIVRSKLPITSLDVKADQGYIQLAISGSYILGTFASKHADESLLKLIVKKAVNAVKPEDVEAMKAKALAPEVPVATAPAPTPLPEQEVPVATAPTPTPASTGEAAPLAQPGTGDVDDGVRVALCQAVKGKVKIMYGDKRAEAIVTEAFQQVGAKRDTRNAQELKSVFDILACGIMAKMLGPKKAKKFLDELYTQHGLK